MKTLTIFDTTLRDGEQAIDCLMSIEKKKKILSELSKLNFDIIELGYPAASLEDYDWFKLAASYEINATVCAFSRPVKHDVQIVANVAKWFNHFRCQLLTCASEIHLENKRRVTVDQSLNELEESVDYLKNNNITNISAILEDSTRGSFNLIEKIIEKCIQLNLSNITLADTLGFTTPDEFVKLVTFAKNLLNDSGLSLGIHTHNDLGLATANALSAIQLGIDEVQTTVGGIGERAGNCSINELMAILECKHHLVLRSTHLRTSQLTHATKSILDILNKDIDPSKPLLGKYVFSTASGIHQDGLLKDKSTYEFINPEKFDGTSTFYFNRLSGKSSLKKLLLYHNIDIHNQFDRFFELLSKKGQSQTVENVISEYIQFINQKQIT